MKKLLVLLIFPVIFISFLNIVNAEFIKNKIAVLDFKLQGKGFETEDLGEIVAEWLITTMVKDGRFDVVERRLLKKIIAEQQLSETGLLDQGTTAQLGKVLGVKVVISGSVMRIKEIIEVNARIIDVESGSILAAESVKNTDASQLKNIVEQMAQKIIKAFPLEGYIVKRQEERVTIDRGRLSGVKPGMQFIVYKEGEVIKHPKTGEVLDVQKNQTGFICIRNVLDKLSEGYIIKETEPKAIQYGQLVKSASKDLTGKSLSKDVKVESSSKDKDIKIIKGGLFINAMPTDSIVRILNIKPKYYRGINLAPGKYHIEVTAPSYQPKTQWINILPGEKKNVSIVLIKLEARKDTQTKVYKIGQMQPSMKPIQNEPEKKAEAEARANAKAEKKEDKYIQKPLPKKNLILAIFPWQLIDEQHWGKDLSRAKIIRALIDTTNQYAHVKLKYSYYRYDKSPNIKIELLTNNIKKFGKQGVWKGKGVIISPNLNNVLNYGKNINADLVLMGNLLFSDIDGQPESSKYQLNLNLVNINTGKIEKKTGFFTERNSVKSIKEITKSVLDTAISNQSASISMKTDSEASLEINHGATSSVTKTIPSIRKDPGNQVKLAIFPWKPSHQYWNKEVLGAIKKSIASTEKINLIFSFYDSGCDLDGIRNLEKLWDGTKPSIDLVRTAAEKMGVDAALMCHVKIHEMDPPDGNVTMFLVDVASGKMYKVNGITDQFDTSGMELSLGLINKLFNKYK